MQKPGLLPEIFRLILYPLLILIWIVEGIVKKISGNKSYQVNSFDVSFIFLAYLFLSAYFILLQNNLFCRIAGLYILTSMEVLSLALSFIVGYGKSISFHNFLQRLGDRQIRHLSNTRNSEGLYRVFITFAYNILYFGFVYIFLYKYSPGAFLIDSRMTSQSLTFDFFFHSASIFTLFNSPITPVSVLAKSLTLLEIGIGLLFVIFIFSSLISAHLRQLENNK